MSQTTFADEDLFGEAAAEMREDVEEHLAAARAELPTADEMWAVEAENVLGALNSLRSALDVGDATEELRQAKKWFTMGERADAFEDADDLEAEIEAVEELIADVEAAHEQVGDLAGTVPELRATLEEVHADADDDADADADEEEAAAEADD